MNKDTETSQFLPLLLLLFFCSGCAALIYEIVWFQLLQLVIGSTAVSFAVLLGTYMGGMGLGSFLFPRLISASHHPLRIYSLIELGIGVMGILVLFGMPAVVRIYTASAGSSGFWGILMRGAVCALCLLIPTFLMGATLPSIARWIKTTPAGVSWLGFLYGGNIAGAVFGCLFAGFYLLRIFDTEIATYTAAGINGVIALICLAISIRSPYRYISEGNGKIPIKKAHGAWTVYITIALSGMCALGAEVVWTRLLSLMMGATVYTFSIILAVFLGGLGIGSGFGSLLVRRKIRTRTALWYCQILLTASIFWAAFLLARSLPYWSYDSTLPLDSIFRLDMLRCLLALLPAAFLWGACFPLALAAVSSPGQDGGRLVGGVYASNTAGAILGAVSFSLVIIPGLGTQSTQRLMIGLSVAAALFVISPLLGKSKDCNSDTAEVRSRKRTIFYVTTMILAALLILCIPKTPWELIAYGRYLPKKTGMGQLLFLGEGMNAFVAVTESDGGTKNFHISGRVEASSSSQDMRMQRMLGHIPGLLHPRPRSVLVVGCGAGVTAGTFVLYPDIERIVLCEIEPLIPQVVARFFSSQNYGVLDDPRVEVVFDDARHFILTSKEKFDIITTDPIHPWIKGSASLYTKEYLELAKRHLKPGGIIVQWVPFYESTSETVKSEMATFFNVFPNGTIWSNEVIGWGYDVVLLGQAGEKKIDVDELQKRLDGEDYHDIAQSLAEIGFKSAIRLLATYAGRASDLTFWLRNAEINRDKNLRLQYLAGLGINYYGSVFIYDDLLTHFKYPPDLFTGSPDRLLELKRALGVTE